MGSNADGLTPPKEDEITVLVTGFGPFRVQNPINPSWEIANALPPYLPASKSHTGSDATTEDPPVRLLVYPQPVKVAYKTVRELVPTLWEGKKIDFAVHIGMASGRKYYSVERRGHRNGYGMRDVDGELLGDVERRQEEGDKWIWYGMPDELLTDVNIDDVFKRWTASLPNINVQVSEDAGRYLCDFIYYSSLAYLYKKGEERRVVFLHVPVECDNHALHTGVEVTLELIRAMIRSGRIEKPIY